MNTNELGSILRNFVFQKGLLYVLCVKKPLTFTQLDFNYASLCSLLYKPLYSLHNSGLVVFGAIFDNKCLLQGLFSPYVAGMYMAIMNLIVSSMLASNTEFWMILFLLCLNNTGTTWCQLLAASGMPMSMSVDIFSICQVVPLIFNGDKVPSRPKWQIWVH